MKVLLKKSLRPLQFQRGLYNMKPSMSRDAKWMGAIGILLVAMAVITGAPFIYFAGWCWIVLLLSSLIIHRVNIKSLTLQFEMDQTEVTAGESIGMRYRVLNNSIVPAYNVNIQPIISKAFGYTSFGVETHAFDSYEMKTIERQVVAMRRGYYTLGRVRLEVSDPLQIKRSFYEKQKVIEVIVRPRVLDVTRLHLKAKELMGWRGQTRNNIQDKTSIKNVREYKDGDSFKDIHYKLSAKTGQLKTKEYTQSVSTMVVMLIDGERRVYEGCETLSDEIMDLAASICADLLKHQIPVKIIFSDDNRTSFSGRNYGAMKSALEHFTAFNPNGFQSFVDFAEKEMKLYSSGVSLITLSRSADSQRIRRLQSMTPRGSSCDHFCLLTPEEIQILKEQDAFFETSSEAVDRFCGDVRLGLSASDILKIGGRSHEK